MSQVQQMQQEMAEQQEALAEETITVTAAGGVISVEITGHQRVKAITIDPEVVDPDDVELTDTLYTDTPDQTLVAATTSLPVEATYSYYLAERTIERLEAWDGEDGPRFHRTDFPGPHHPYTRC